MNAELVIRDATTERKGGMATVVFASSVGTTIECYDFFHLRHCGGARL
jgi:hypothetical protein